MSTLVEEFGYVRQPRIRSRKIGERPASAKAAPKRKDDEPPPQIKPEEESSSQKRPTEEISSQKRPAEQQTSSLEGKRVKSIGTELSELVQETSLFGSSPPAEEKVSESPRSVTFNEVRTRSLAVGTPAPSARVEVQKILEANDLMHAGQQRSGKPAIHPKKLLAAKLPEDTARSSPTAATHAGDAKRSPPPKHKFLAPMKEPWNELDLFASSRSSKGDGDAQLTRKPTVMEPPRVVEVKTVADAPDDVDYLYLV